MIAFAKLCLITLAAGWMIYNTAFVDSISASLQQTPSVTSPADSSRPAAQAKPNQPLPNPDASGKYHVGNGVKPPQLIYSVEPRFSKEAEKKRLGGKCIVSVTVSATGTPLDIHITKSIAEGVREEFRDAALSLDENCVKAVEQYRFKPGTYQGRPVPVELRVEVTYNGY